MGGDGFTYFTQSNSEYSVNYHASQTVGAKLHWSKGKQPRPSIKVPKFMLSGEGGLKTVTIRRLA